MATALSIIIFIFFNNITFLFGLPLLDVLTMYDNSSTTELFNCLSNVTRTYFDRQTIYFSFNELGTVDNTVTIDSFAKAVQSPKVIMPYSSFADAQQIKGVFVFLAEEDHLYRQLLNITQQNYFVVVWTKEIPMNNIRQVFRDFWVNGKHINVIGLVTMIDGSVNVYTYRPFSNYGCSKLGRPFLLDHWENGKFKTGVNLLSHKSKTGNMRECPLKCIGNEQPPDSIIKFDGHGWTTSGVGGKVLEIVAKHMNFVPVITSVKGNQSDRYSWYNSADMLDNITAMLYSEEVDLAFGWYSYATHNNNEFNTELAKTTSIDCLGWAVPYRAGLPPASWTNYVYEFDQVGWLFIGSMFVVVVG